MSMSSKKTRADCLALLRAYHLRRQRRERSPPFTQNTNAVKNTLSLGGQEGSFRMAHLRVHSLFFVIQCFVIFFLSNIVHCQH